MILNDSLSLTPERCRASRIWVSVVCKAHSNSFQSLENEQKLSSFVFTLLYDGVFSFFKTFFSRGDIASVPFLEFASAWFGPLVISRDVKMLLSTSD